MTSFDMEELGRRLGGWRHKNGQAAEYKASGSNYRTYRPMVSTNPSGEMSISTKLDHIRGAAKDDHCQLDLLVLPSGELGHWRTQVQIQGSPQFDSGLVGSAAGLAGPKYGAIALAAADVLNSVSTFVTGLGEHGGRAAFPAVIRMNLDHIAACVQAGFNVYGAIGEKYAALGGAGGFLGAPLTDETGTPDGIGRYNHFQHGSIYWTPKTGAFEVHGSIRDKWAAMGWERSYLGYPISDEINRPGGGRTSRFQNGAIHWTSQKGAWDERSLKVANTVVATRIKGASATLR
jgi:hypothetical protein